MSKNWVETEEPQMTSQYSAYALRAGLARLHGRTRMPTPTRPDTHVDARACTHRPVSNIYCFFMATVIRERASILRHTYIACLVITETACVYCAVRTGSLNVIQFVGLSGGGG